MTPPSPFLNPLDDLKTIRRWDPSDMLGRVRSLPQMCLDGWQEGLQWRLPSSYSNSHQLLVLGMGGSAIGADLLQGLAGGFLEHPLSVNRDYRLPSWVGRSTLVLVSSYSGNTEETLSAFAQAQKTGAKIAAITSGGKLAAVARQKKIPLLVIPPGLPPRSALGYMAFAPLGMLARLGWINATQFPMEKVVGQLEKFILNTLHPEIPSRSNPAKRLARQMLGKLPILYGASGGWEGIAYRWRTQLEENAKTLAFHHLFPEATHNEISGWVQPRQLLRQTIAIFLTDTAIHPRTQRRMKFTAGMIEKEGSSVVWVKAPGGSVLERSLKLVVLGDFASVYLALLYRIDPTPVVRVEALKKFMAQ